MKISAVEAIKKFYAEKGFQSAQVKILGKADSTYENTLLLDFVIDKGPKVRINNINFGGNTVEAGLLKKKLKEIHEKSRLTLFPVFDEPKIVKIQRYSFEQYMKEKGFLTFTKTKKVLDPYARIKFSSAKFDTKKY
jgi:outer membrane protein insertion porin family